MIVDVMKIFWKILIIKQVRDPTW